MKRFILTFLCMVFTMTLLNAATPEKYFEYDLASEAILKTVGLEGDYICITDIYEDKLEADGITEIEFPKEIEGLKVIAICGKIDLGFITDLHIESNIKTVIIPETYELVNYKAEHCPITKFTGTTTRPLYFGRAVSFYDKTFIEGHAQINGGLPQPGRKVYFPRTGDSESHSIKINGIETLTVSKNWIFDYAVEQFDKYSYVKSDSITELIFEEGCINICSWNSPKLAKVTLAKSIKEIVADAFEGNPNLSEVVFPEGAKYSYPDNYRESIFFTSKAFSGCAINSIKAKTALKATGYNGEF